jgi:hypothetical protein
MLVGSVVSQSLVMVVVRSSAHEPPTDPHEASAMAFMLAAEQSPFAPRATRLETQAAIER